MPATASIVDELRQAFGQAVVDGAIASGRQLQREHDRIAAVMGAPEAARWLARQHPRAGAFRATEAGRTVGALP